MPSLKYILPMAEVRFSHFGSLGFSGGFDGLKLTWQSAHAMPTL
jgi:hypothetical protein